MITFLPTSDFTESAAMLDSKRLGNQRVEARMILRWLRNPREYPRQQNAGYTIMWKGYDEALCVYYNSCCEEWARRGGKNLVCQPEPVVKSRVKLPPWLGDDELHVTHRSALLHKLPEHYSKYGWKEEIPDPKVDYLWPRPVEGKPGEYELCPAFWKKKKKQTTSTKASPQKTKAKHTTNAKPIRASKSSVKKNKNKRDTIEGRYPTRRPRRSVRLAGK